MPGVSHKRDRAEIGTPSSPSGGNPLPMYTYGSAVRCRYSRNSTREVMDGSQQAYSDVTFYFPRDTAIASGYRIKLTRYRNTDLDTPEYYVVIGEPHQTMHGGDIAAPAQRIHGESVK